MTENKKYEITFTKNTEVTFYDKNHRDTTRLIKVGEKITATFTGIPTTNTTFRSFKCGKELFAIPVYVFDSIRVTRKKKVPMKQVTAMVQIAITMEVPKNMTTKEIKEMVKFNTVWDVTSEYPNANMVEVSDILAVNSITEAPID